MDDIVTHLDAWSVPLGWVGYVNGIETASEGAALQRSVRRGTPFGSVAWQQETAQRLGREYTLRPLGRPRKRQPGTDTSASRFDTSSHRIDPP